MDIGSPGTSWLRPAEARPPRVEIERKFLVRDDAWRLQAFAIRRLRDGLLSSEGGATVRVRTDGQQASVTVKGPRAGLVRAEFEYPIPPADAEAMLGAFCAGRLVEKDRHLVRHGRHVWEVDVYAGALSGIVHAEVELAAEDEPVELPGWVGAEITGDPVHSKRALLLRLATASVA